MVTSGGGGINYIYESTLLLFWSICASFWVKVSRATGHHDETTVRWSPPEGACALAAGSSTAMVNVWRHRSRARMCVCVCERVRIEMKGKKEVKEIQKKKGDTSPESVLLNRELFLKNRNIFRANLLRVGLRARTGARGGSKREREREKK